MSAYPPEECCAHPADHHGPEAGGCIDCRCTACPKVTPDAVTAATPTLRHHDDGRLILEWADEPAVGALVVVKADVLRRLVDKVNGGPAMSEPLTDEQAARELLAVSKEMMIVLNQATRPDQMPEAQVGASLALVTALRSATHALLDIAAAIREGGAR